MFQEFRTHAVLFPICVYAYALFIYFGCHCWMPVFPVIKIDFINIIATKLFLVMVLNLYLTSE